MANTIQLKRSAVQGNVPTTGQLALGEIGINTYDGKVFIKKDNGSASIVEVGPSPITYDGTSTNLVGPFPAADTPGTANVLLGNTTYAITNGFDNVGVGTLALRYTTTGRWNVGVGKGALRSNTSGGHNTAVGNTALYTNYDGYENVAIGESALHDNYGGYYNVAVGTYALISNTSGTSNTAVGQNALYFNLTGTTNTAVGASALYKVTGSTNVGIGNSAAGNTTSGANNVAVGVQALSANSTGSSNTAIGRSAGYNLTTGDNNTLIGGYQGTAGMAGNVVLSTGDGTVRFQHDGTNWTSATPISTTGLILPSTTSPITLNASVGTSGQVLTSAGTGATPTWTTSYGPSFVTYTSSATTVDQVIDTNATSAAGTVKYTVQITSGGERHSCEILVTHDGTNTVSTEYAVIDTGAGSLATFNTDINTGNLRLLTTPTNAVTVYNILKTIIAP